MSRGIALVTGASSGIGEALAREFAKRDYDLIITARRESNLKSLAEELSHAVNVDVVVNDLATDAGPARLIEAVSALDKPVDVLINNAGVAISGNFHELGADEVDNLISLNMRAVALLTHHFLPIMVRRGAGRILNVASVAAFQPIPAMSLYAATKSFVLSLTEAVSEELRGTGVSITALCPGVTRAGSEAVRQHVLPDFMISSPAEVAREGYDALMANEVIRVPGRANQAAVAWSGIQPRWITRRLTGLVSRWYPRT